MRVEGSCLATVQDMIFSGGIGQSKDAVAVAGVLLAACTVQKETKKRKATYDGSDDGAHTMAMASGSPAWYDACVCKSLELIKHVCVGCVWIQP